MTEKQEKIGAGEESPSSGRSRHGPEKRDSRKREKSPVYSPFDAMCTFFRECDAAPPNEHPEARALTTRVGKRGSRKPRAAHQLFSISDPNATGPYMLTTDMTPEERAMREDQLKNPMKYAGVPQFLIGYEEYPEPDPIVTTQGVFKIRKHPLLPDWNAWSDMARGLYLIRPAPLDPTRDGIGPAQMIMHLDNLVRDCSYIFTGKADMSLARLNVAAISSSAAEGIIYCMKFWEACRVHNVVPAQWIGWKFSHVNTLTKGGTKKLNVLIQILSPDQVTRNDIRGIYRKENPGIKPMATQLRGGEGLSKRLHRLRANLDRMCIYRSFRVSDRDIQFLMDRIFPGGLGPRKNLVEQLLKYCEVRNGIWRQAAMEGRYLWGPTSGMRNNRA